MPNNVQGYVRSNEAIRLRIIASGQNTTSSKPLFIEIAWDGDWTTTREEMQSHLVVNEIESL